MTPVTLRDAPPSVLDLPGQGIRLGYRQAGHGAPLVLAMGLGADAAAWEPHLRAWSRRFRCIAVDNRGAGASSAPPGPYNTAQLADDYAELIIALGLGPVPVVGISMGGTIAQELALRHPALVSRLVLVSSWARLDSYAAQVFANLAAVRAQADRATFTWLLQLWIWSAGWFEQAGGSLTAERAAFEAQAAACIGHDALSRLGDITVPVLITAGDRDVFTPPRFAEQLAGAIPCASLTVFPGAAHTHHWERLDEFNALVEEWLE
jgi:pimeloyl-ACP methyl ester carboxylesterase